MLRGLLGAARSAAASWWKMQSGSSASIMLSRSSAWSSKLLITSARVRPSRSLEPPEDVPVGYCEHCGGEIYEGETVYRIDGQLQCSHRVPHGAELQILVRHINFAGLHIDRCVNPNRPRQVSETTVERLYREFSETRAAGWLYATDENIEAFADWLNKVEL